MMYLDAVDIVDLLDAVGMVLLDAVDMVYLGDVDIQDSFPDCIVDTPGDSYPAYIHHIFAQMAVVAAVVDSAEVSVGAEIVVQEFCWVVLSVADRPSEVDREWACWVAHSVRGSEEQLVAVVVQELFSQVEVFPLDWQFEELLFAGTYHHPMTSARVGSDQSAVVVAVVFDDAARGSVVPKAFGLPAKVQAFVLIGACQHIRMVHYRELGSLVHRSEVPLRCVHYLGGLPMGWDRCFAGAACSNHENHAACPLTETELYLIRSQAWYVAFSQPHQCSMSQRRSSPCYQLPQNLKEERP